jgi:hypothetical protein
MKRVLLTLVWILIATVICSAQTTLYFPQVANGIQSDGVSWKTTLFITNTAAANASNSNVTIAFTTSQGAPYDIAFTGTGFSSTSNTVSMTIAGGQSRKLVSSGAGGLTIGYATMSVTSADVTGTAVFSEFAASGALISEASVPAAVALERQAIFVDTQGGFSTAVAYANPNAEPATITLALLNSQGVNVLPSTQRSLAGTTHTAAFVNELFPGPQAQGVAGTMQVTSTVPLAAIALRFSPGGVFTTLPPVSIASLLDPAVEWLERRPWISPFTSLAKLLGALKFRIG